MSTIVPFASKPTLTPDEEEFLQMYREVLRVGGPIAQETLFDFARRFLKTQKLDALARAHGLR